MVSQCGLRAVIPFYLCIFVRKVLSQSIGLNKTRGSKNFSKFHQKALVVQEEVHSHWRVFGMTSPSAQLEPPVKLREKFTLSGFLRPIFWDRTLLMKVYNYKGITAIRPC